MPEEEQSSRCLFMFARFFCRRPSFSNFLTFYGRKLGAQHSTTKGGQLGAWRFWQQASLKKKHSGSKRNVLHDLIRNTERNSDHGLREHVILGGLTEMSSTFVLNPDNRIVGVVALIVHYCFH